VDICVLGLIQMKNIYYILIFLFLVGCTSTRKLVKDISKPSKFVFKKSLVSTKNGISGLKAKQDSLIDTAYHLKGKDSLINKKLKEMNMINFLTQAPEIEIHIEVQSDSIWRYRKQNGKIIGDYFMVLKNSGILNYYDKSKTVNYRKYDLFTQNHEYEISENKKDRKEIKGFYCYKLTFVEIDKESDLGNTIYEMYVTDQIELPVHSVINFSKLVPNTFPMEIKVKKGKLSGMAERYELIKIKY